jgi:serine/threonine protein kinase
VYEYWVEEGTTSGFGRIVVNDGGAARSRVGIYEITALLGRGGMSEVYRVRDTKLGREVAIKILPDVWVTDPDRRARLDREARVLASLNHPHIGAIYGTEESSDFSALVLELVEGETLAERLSRLEPTRSSAPRWGPGSAPGQKAGLPLNESLEIARHAFTGYDDAQIYAQSLETGQCRPLVKGSGASYLPTGHLVYVQAGTLMAVPFDSARLEATSRQSRCCPASWR